MPRKLALFCTVLALSTLGSGTARASGSLELTGAQAAGSGQLARVTARGPEAAYYNPALLPDLPGSIALGAFFLASHESVKLAARPAGVDVPKAIYDARVLNPDGTTARLTLRPLPTAEMPEARGDTDETDTLPYLSIGVVRPLAKQALVFGFYAVLPVTSFQKQSAFFVDEREQYFNNRLRFELLGDRLPQTSLALALGSRPAEWVSLGIGADLTFGTVVHTQVHVPDAADQSVVLLNPDIEVTSTISPYFGLAVLPMRTLRVTSTLHLPVSADTDGENKVRFWNYTYPEGQNAVQQLYAMSLGYEPLRFSVGGNYEIMPVTNGFGVEVSAQALYGHWATYRDRHGEAPVVPFKDTVSVTAGGAVNIRDQRITFSGMFAPSPVPAQSGRSNYVDGSRVGADLAYESRFSPFGVPLRATARLFGQVILARKETKSASAQDPVLDEVPDNATDVATGQVIEGAAGLQTNNPGYPGYESSGWLLGAGLSLVFPSEG